MFLLLFCARNCAQSFHTHAFILNYWDSHTILFYRQGHRGAGKTENPCSRYVEVSQFRTIYVGWETRCCRAREAAQCTVG